MCGKLRSGLSRKSPFPLSALRVAFVNHGIYISGGTGRERAEPRSTLTNDYAITADNSAASKQNEKYRSGWQRWLCRLLNLSSGEFVLAMRIAMCNAFACV